MVTGKNGKNEKGKVEKSGKQKYNTSMNSSEKKNDNQKSKKGAVHFFFAGLIAGTAVLYTFLHLASFSIFPDYSGIFTLPLYMHVITWILIVSVAIYNAKFEKWDFVEPLDPLI